MIKSFIVGVIAGAVAMWLWGDEIRAYLDERTRDVRARAAGPLHAVADTVETVAARVEGAATPRVERAM